MRTAIEQSGAVRALLILSREAGPRIVAESMTGDTIAVELRDEPLTAPRPNWLAESDRCCALCVRAWQTAFCWS
jgi:hypothetical protein